MKDFVCGRRALPLALVALTALVAAWFAAPAARAETPPIVVEIPAGVAGFSCNGEAFATEGDIHITVKTTTAGSGNFHVTMIVKYDAVTGVTVTGKRFRSDFSIMFEQTLAAGMEMTNVVSGRFVLSGEVAPLPDDFYFHSIAHMTVTPAGVPVVNVSDQRTSCQ